MTATTDDGVLAFINLDAGDYTLTVDGEGSCVGDFVALSGDNQWDVPVEAGHLTAVFTDCPDGPGTGFGGAGAGGAGGAGAGGAGAGGN